MGSPSPTASPIGVNGAPQPHSGPIGMYGSPSPTSSSCPIGRPIAEPHSPTAAPPRPLPMGQLRYGVSMGRDGAEFPLISIGAVGLRAPVGVYGVLWGFMGRCGALTVSMGPPHNSSPLRTALEDSGAQRRAGQSATGRGGVTERIPQRGEEAGRKEEPRGQSGVSDHRDRETERRPRSSGAPHWGDGVRRGGRGLCRGAGLVGKGRGL